MRRNDVISTSIRSHFNVIGPWVRLYIVFSSLHQKTLKHILNCFKDPIALIAWKSLSLQVPHHCLFIVNDRD